MPPLAAALPQGLDLRVYSHSRGDNNTDTRICGIRIHSIRIGDTHGMGDDNTVDSGSVGDDRNQSTRHQSILSDSRLASSLRSSVSEEEGGKKGTHQSQQFVPRRSRNAGLR